MANELAVRLRNLHKSFGEGSTRVEVLHGVDLDVECGEMLLLAGPSGCGKTTLLCLIAGLLDPNEGTIQVFGKALEKMSSDELTQFRMDHLGFVFQQFNLVPALTARENAAVPLLIKGMPRQEAFKKAEELLERVGLSRRVHALPNKLSGGEQQRVAIARALAAEPRLLICDEPTASLDGDTGQQIMTLLRQMALSAERAIIVVTHDQRIFKFGDRLAKVLDGRIASVQRLFDPNAPNSQAGF